MPLIGSLSQADDTACNTVSNTQAATRRLQTGCNTGCNTRAANRIDTSGALCYIIVKIILVINFGGPVAQWIEQRFPKPRVGRSIRLGATSFISMSGLWVCAGMLGCLGVSGCSDSLMCYLLRLYPLPTACGSRRTLFPEVKSSLIAKPDRSCPGLFVMLL